MKTDTDTQAQTINENKSENKENENDTQFMYEEFLPLELYRSDLLEKESDHKIKLTKFSTFGLAVDTFYTSMESMKSESKQSRNEQLAWKKLLKAKTQHEERILSLENEANINEFYANVILENLEFVDRAIDGVNILLKQGESWYDLSNRIKEDAMYGNPIAKLIVSLKLHENIITLKLPHIVENIIDNNENDIENDQTRSESDNESENESELSDMFDEETTNSTQDRVQTTTVTTEYYKINIDLNLSAWNNAKKYFGMKKSYLDKKNKTLDATKLAIKAAEVKTRQALEEAKLVSNITSMRKTFWFEKFYWFISSDNYLVIGGRDAQQNEIIVKKYMSKNYDIYVHAHIHGASSVIIKAPQNSGSSNNSNSIGITKDLVSKLKQKYGNKYDISKDRRYFNIPERTLQEAGAMCVCRSIAWKNNVTTQAYWVFGYQVSKTAPTQEYLPTGSFVIRGKKNFIMPQPLVMGCVILFKIDRNSYVRNHTHERCVKYFDKSESYSESSSINGTQSENILSNNDKNDESDPNNKLKKSQDDNQIYITKTMVQVTGRDRANRAKMKGKTNEQNKDSNKGKGAKKSKKKMNKRLAKMGLIGKQAVMENNGETNGDNEENTTEENSEQSSKNSRNSKNRNNKGNKGNNKRQRGRKRGGNAYRNKYGSEDEQYVKQLLGIKDEIVNKEDENESKDSKQEKEENEKFKVIERNKEGYGLTEKTEKEKERLKILNENLDVMDKNEQKMNENSNNISNNNESKVDNNENNENNGNNENKNDEMDEFELQRQDTIKHTIENEIRLLTGDPVYINTNEKISDIILYALPMCAPWSVINNDSYKFKIKIQPGRQKRGTAVKHVMKIFESMSESYSNNSNNSNNSSNSEYNKNNRNNNRNNKILNIENESNNDDSNRIDTGLTQFIKCVKDTEISSVFLSDVKISAVGLREIEENERKKKQMIQKQQWQENLLNQKKLEMQNKDLKDKLKSVQPKKRKKRSKR